MATRSRTKAGKPRSATPATPPHDAPTFGGPKDGRLDVMPGQYFIRVHPDAIRSHVATRGRARSGAARMAFTAATAASVPESIVEPLDFLRDNVGLKNVRPLFTEGGRAGVARASVSGRQRDRLAVAAAVITEAEDDLAGIAIAELDPKASQASIRRARSARAIDFIEPVPTRWLAAGKTADPMQNLQWGLRAIRWFDATRPDASSVSVGILDTGIDRGHPDLAGVQVDYHHPRSKAEDIIGHGTHVAGIVAAETNNDVGIAGVASCALQMWKVFLDEPDQGEYYVDPNLFADALRAAALSGLSAVNMSLGGTQSSQTERILIRRLVDAGVVVVAAMGNEYNDGNPVEYPAAYDGVLAVGAIAETRERSDFSNTGSHIGICAPGSNILSTLPRKTSSYRSETNYAAWSGTSMATPHVAAAAALVAAKEPTKGGLAIAERLRDTAATLAGMGNHARTNEYGDGLLDVARALS
jgi:subtilisin family serine protease